MIWNIVSDLIKWIKAQNSNLKLAIWCYKTKQELYSSQFYDAAGRSTIYDNLRVLYIVLDCLIFYQPPSLLLVLCDRERDLLYDLVVVVVLTASFVDRLFTQHRPNNGWWLFRRLVVFVTTFVVVFVVLWFRWSGWGLCWSTVVGGLVDTLSTTTPWWRMLMRLFSTGVHRRWSTECVCASTASPSGGFPRFDGWCRTISRQPPIRVCDGWDCSECIICFSRAFVSPDCVYGVCKYILNILCSVHMIKKIHLRITVKRTQWRG